MNGLKWPQQNKKNQTKTKQNKIQKKPDKHLNGHHAIDDPIDHYIYIFIFLLFILLLLLLLLTQQIIFIITVSLSLSIYFLFLLFILLNHILIHLLYHLYYVLDVVCCCDGDEMTGCNCDCDDDCINHQINYLLHFYY